MIKLIVTDLDGTLFTSDHLTISERNIKALKRAREKGIKLAISSGRAYCLLDDVIRQLGAVDYIMTSNGAASADSSGRIISADFIEYEEWKNIYATLAKEGIVTEVYCGGNTYLNKEDFAKYENPSLGEPALNVLKGIITPCGDVLKNLEGKSAEKLYSIYVEKEVFDRFKEKFEKIGMEVTSSIPHNMEISKKGINKGRGLKKLCSALGIDLDEVMAFGDEENDIEMLKAAGYSYAMKNASKAVKETAKFITESNDNDGVAAAVEKLLN
ncbi:MAG: HAD family hydrolase [Clostridiales bacterium]|nr:HAD family hydrolase [Clostridiales bacterium]